MFTLHPTLQHTLHQNFKHQPPEYQETLLILSVAMMKHNGPDE